MIGLEQIYISLGFSGPDEYQSLTGAVDLQTPEQFAAFEKWQAEDGTKEGLEALLESLSRM
jgi:hypothetical protein